MNKTNKTSLKIIDTDTGEVIRDINEGDKIITKEQSDYKNNHIIGFNKKTPFVKVYMGEFSELHKELSGAEIMLLYSLIPFISYQDNILRIDNKFMKIKDISDMLEKDNRWIREIISSLEKKEIIKKTKWFDKHNKKEMKCIVINPYLFFCGSDLRKEIESLFSNCKWNKRG